LGEKITMNNIKKLKNAKKVLVNLDQDTVRALNSIKTKTRRSKSSLIRDAIKHTALSIELFATMNELDKKD
jgi:predicted transcriptional regulator